MSSSCSGDRPVKRDAQEVIILDSSSCSSHTEDQEQTPSKGNGTSSSAQDRREQIVIDLLDDDDDEEGGDQTNENDGDIQKPGMRDNLESNEKPTSALKLCGPNDATKSSEPSHSEDTQIQMNQTLVDDSSSPAIPKLRHEMTDNSAALPDLEIDFARLKNTIQNSNPSREEQQKLPSTLLKATEIDPNDRKRPFVDGGDTFYDKTFDKKKHCSNQPTRSEDAQHSFSNDGDDNYSNSNDTDQQYQTSDYDTYLLKRNERFLRFHGQSSEMTRKEIGFWQGNGIDRGRITNFIGQEVSQCGSCRACKATRCYRCTLCRFGTDWNANACVFRCCENNGKTYVELYLRELAAMLARNDRCLNVNDRVYCRYINNKWYWGTITQQLKSGRFSVQYDDGDQHNNVLDSDVLNEFEVDIANEETHLDDNTKGYIIPFQDEDIESESSHDKSSSHCPNETDDIPAIVLVEANYERSQDQPCGSCALCVRPNCNKCASCLDGALASSDSKPCFQKMCLAMPLSLKAKEAPGIPIGWKFAFCKKASNPSVSDHLRGLRIISPSGKAYFSVERAMRQYRTESAKSRFNPLLFYKYVGLSMVTDAEKANGECAIRVLKPRRILSSEKKLHARVYAKFLNGEFYWGHITNISGTKEHKMYKIEFDDGDVMEGLEENDIYTEKDYKVYFKMDPPDPTNDVSIPMSPVELFLRRCKSCSLCTRKDCGKCSGCLNNQTTCPYRYVCLRKVCLQINAELKAQHCPGLPGWRYFFVDHDEPNLIRSQTELIGLQFISASGAIEFHMKDVLKTFRFRKEVADKRLQDFYENHLGISIRTKVEEHFLLGKPWYNEWIDVQRRSREIWGTITNVWKDSNEDFIFQVDYNKSLHAEAHVISGELGNLPLFDDQVTSEDAWGGFVAALGQQLSVHHDRKPISVCADIPFFSRRVLPSSRLILNNSTQLPVHQMIFAGFLLSLEARPSDIPNAGLGLWLSVVSLWPHDERECLELDPGVLIDIGVYAPLLPSDRKSDKISLVKNFLYNWDPEGWNYEMAMHEKGGNYDIFDITDDLTGKLHASAKRNIICYVNETDGKEVPDVVGLHDPEGAIHYFLGHRFKDQGPLKFPTNGTPVELKIDYGPKYEKCRVRKGYPRVCRTELTQIRKIVARDNDETVQELDHFSANDLLECILFLEGILNSEPWNPSIKCLERFLTLALAIHYRCNSIAMKFDGFDITDKESFCNNGFTEMKRNRTIERAKSLVFQVYLLFGEDKNQFQASLRSMRLLKKCFALCVGKLPIQVDALSLDDIHKNFVAIFGSCLQE